MFVRIFKFLQFSKGDGWLHVLCAFLGIASFFDYTRGKIPNLLQVVVFVWGIVRSVCVGGAEGLLFYLLSVGGVLLLLYPLFRIGGLGAGDVKLFSVCSGYFSVSQIFWFLFCSMLISAVFSLFTLVLICDFRLFCQLFEHYAQTIAQLCHHLEV